VKCHNCQEKTQVEETRVLPENPRWTKRRRVCKHCGFTLWTIEMPAEDVVVKEEKGLQLQIAEREHTAVIETIDELMGMESDRHPMFSEGYDHALDHIKQFVQGRGKK
jgi:transcriptional regulator NrdR family protein